MCLLYIGLFFVLFIRLVFIQATGEVHGQELKDQAEKRYSRTLNLQADRGKILDRNEEIIASDTISYRLVAALDEGLSSKNGIYHVVDPEKTAEVLKNYLPMEKEELVERLTRTEEDKKERKKKQVEFGKAGSNINHDTALEIKEDIEEHKLTGILLLEEKKRFYPNGVFAPYLVGFAQREYDENGKLQMVGKMGLEKIYDELLTGKDGNIDFQADRWGVTLPKTEKIVTQPEDGYTIKLTIDKAIQNFVEDALTEVDDMYAPEKMMAIVVDPKTGEILAMSQRPAFDPSTREGLTSNWLNEAIENTIEPGSTMKIFTLAAAIEEGKWNPDAYFQSGQYTLYDRTIRDHKRGGWGSITYLEGFQRSSNVSMANLLDQMGSRTFIEYVEKFGFGEKTGIDLPNEAAGIILDYYPLERLTTSFGQGTTVTPMQMIQGATAIANDGKMMKPYVIEEIVNPNTGEVLQSGSPEEKESPISAKTAQGVREVLHSTVTADAGSGRMFAIPGYDVGGKTGTAEIPNGKGGYRSGNGNYLYSFIGMAPIDNPELLTYVFVQKPQLDHGASGHDPVSKLFTSITENSLKYLNITTNEGLEIDVPTIDDYVSQSSEEAVEALEAAGYHPIVLGEGGEVVQQYPTKGTHLSTSSIVLLKTDGEITLPDFTNWSKKMVLSYKMLSGLDIRIVGGGYVTEQSQSAGNQVNPNEPILIQLKQPEEIYDPAFEEEIEEIIGG